MDPLGDGATDGAIASAKHQSAVSVASTSKSKIAVVRVGASENRTQNARPQQTVTADKLPQFVAVRCEGFRGFYGRFFRSPLFIVAF